MKMIAYALFAISLVLICWGLLGLVEYTIPTLDIGLQNDRFPAGLQFLHFLSILITGTTFVVGYVSRWRHTPFATIVMFAVLATLCFVETVDFDAFGGGSTRFLAMAFEYIVYVGFSIFLLRSTVMRHHFRH